MKHAMLAAMVAVCVVIAGVGVYLISREVKPAEGVVTLNTPTGTTSNSTTLTWSQSTDADFVSYAVYKSTSSDTLGDLVTTITDRATTSYTVTDLSPSTTYYFTIKVNRAAGAYDSNQVSATTSAGGVTQNDWNSGSDAGNTFDTALTISPGSGTGYVDSTDEDDYYKVYVPSNTTHISVSITSPSEADLILCLYDPAQSEVQSPFVKGGQSEFVRHSSPSSGYWYVRAYRCSGSGTYSMTVSVFTLVKIDAAPDKGFNWPYYLAIPYGPANSTLIVETNNTGFPSDDQSVHDEAARELAEGRIDYFVEALNCPLLVPTFPRPYRLSHDTLTTRDFEFYTHCFSRNTLTTTLEGLVRLDRQLLAMVEDARGRLADQGLYTDEKFFIMGFSGSGIFANRFCVLHPGRIKAAAMGGIDWPIAPVASWEGQVLRYHVGVADLQGLVGAPFDLETFKNIPLFFFRGDQDTNDSVTKIEAYEPQDRNLVISLFGETPIQRWPIAEQIYKSVGCGCTFKLYPGVGHTYSDEMIEDVIQFFKANL